jgi:DNA-binding LacI/PurR family transcriptional regulator
MKPNSAKPTHPPPKNVPARAPTTADIAREVGVSRATVSYVLNGTPNTRISAETRAKILAAAEKLGYTPHALAKSLRVGHSNTILFPQLDHPIAPAIGQFYEDLGKALRALGYNLLIQLNPEMRDVEAAREWASWRPAGILVEIDRVSPRAIKLLKTAGIPAVVVIGDTTSPLVPSVLADQTEIGAFAGEYLVERGYRELAAVVPREQGNRRLGLGRLKGIERVAEKYRVTAHHFDMAFDAAEAAQVAQQVRALEKPIGILGYNDEYAILLMRAVEQLSLQVPREVALVGVGNRPICTLVRPQLTSVQNKTSHNIQEIANLFDALIQGRAIRKKVVSLFSPTIEVRETA